MYMKKVLLLSYLLLWETPKEPKISR